MQGEQISVIIPMYNAQGQIRKCVDSLLAQTYKDFEIVLVNDGSKDNSLVMCKDAYGSDPRVKIIDKPNGGVSDARNTGLRAASGDYVAFVDADDWVEPAFLARLHEELVQSDADVCIMDYKVIADHPEKISKRNIEKNESVSAHTALASFFDAGFPTFACAKLYRRKIIEGLFFPLNVKIGEDAYFVYCALQRSRTVRILQDPLYNYWLDNAAGATNNFFRRYDYEAPHFATLILQDLPKTAPDLLRQAGNFLMQPAMRSFFGHISTKNETQQSFRDLYNALQTIFRHADRTKKYRKYRLFFQLYQSRIFRPVCRAYARRVVAAKL